MKFINKAFEKRDRAINIVGLKRRKHNSKVLDYLLKNERILASDICFSNNLVMRDSAKKKFNVYYLQIEHVEESDIIEVFDFLERTKNKTNGDLIKLLGKFYENLLYLI